MDRIFADIRESVEQEATQLVDRAKRVAAREKQHAEREADGILSANRANVERDIKVREERSQARRLVDARKAALAEREAFVEEVFSRALEQLRSVPRDATYRAWIDRLLTRAAARFGDEKPRVQCNATDRDIVAQVASAHGLELEAEAADIAGGVVLTSSDGRLTVDCSTEAELARAQESLRDAVLAKLELNDQ